jgi:uncharacterized RDD family membrane protein YckC
MKCPKCGYLGFEDIERCRNCGYEFSLIQPSHSNTPLELPLRKDEAIVIAPDDDLVLADTRGVRPRQASADVERPTAPRPAPAVPQSELPLFIHARDDDTPLITTVTPARAPLSVRRTTADAPRVRAEPRRAPLFDPPAGFIDGVLEEESIDRPVAAEPVTPGLREETAGLGARLAAVFLDLAILALVDAIVVYFTLQICGLTPQEFEVIPKVPLVAFLLVQNGGYLVAFTVGGQTLGKIAAGIRVVSSDPDAPLDAGRALIRTVVWLGLAVPAGLGFLTTVFGPDHRGLHDRWAGTRVVRVAS